MLELPIAVFMLGTFKDFRVCLQAEPGLAKQFGHGLAMGCLAPFVFISLTIKLIYNSLHSIFENNSPPICPLDAERKNRESRHSRRPWGVWHHSYLSH